MVDILKELENFIPYRQQGVLTNNYLSKTPKLVSLAERVRDMPKTYDTDILNIKDKIAYLHYYAGGMDWYVIEKDMLPEQRQAFGVIRNGAEVEFGYIDITALQSISVIEFDFYWRPVPLKDIYELRNFVARFKIYDEMDDAQPKD